MAAIILDDIAAITPPEREARASSSCEDIEVADGSVGASLPMTGSPPALARLFAW